MKIKIKNKYLENAILKNMSSFYRHRFRLYKTRVCTFQNITDQTSNLCDT